MNLDAIRALVASELSAVDELICQQLNSPIELINTIGKHIIASGGKRMRPILVLLSAHCFGYSGTAHIDLAATIELIHTATLLHDDVVDASLLRRGRQTANAIWDNAACVLVGDFLYSRGFQLMVDVQNLQVLACLASATNTIAEGEVLQLLNRHNPDTSEAIYMQVIQHKTGTLFQAAAELGAILGNAVPEVIAATAAYGLHLGIGFQLIDDALDYTSDAEQIGKNIGDDLAEGKCTLPVLHAIQHSNAEQRELLCAAITQGDRDQLPLVLNAIEATAAITYTYQVAQQQIALAKSYLATLPDSIYRQALIGLADFAIARQY